jgi:hypothetical protein
MRWLRVSFCLLALATLPILSACSDADNQQSARPGALKNEAVQKETVQKETVQDVVYITRTGKRYHRDGCRYLSKSKIQIDRDHAIQEGYTPCKVCRP